MIITVTLNAAIDKTLEVPNFRLGRRHRSVEQRTMAGGKGVNVARAVKRLGQPVIATGFAGGPAGTRIVEQLTEESILNDFVRIREESRTNTAVLDPTSGEQTEINEPGPEVTQREVELFTDKLLYLAQGAQLVVFAGSLPRGIESDLYAHLIRELRKLGVTTVVDSDGEPMRHAVRAEPTVVSPNVLEAEELVGHEFNDDEDRTIAVRELVELGARRGDHDRLRRVLRPSSSRTAAPACTGCAWTRASRARRRIGRRLPRRLRVRSLHRLAARGMPALRGRLRGRVHPAPRRGRDRPARGRAPDRGDHRRGDRDPGRGLVTPNLRVRPPGSVGAGC